MTGPKVQTAPGIWWMARDFRFSDNPALRAAMQDGPLLAVFIVDAQLRAQGSASRWRLERALAAFDAELRRRGSGRGVHVVEGDPDQVLADLVRKTGARRVHQSDWPVREQRLTQDKVRASLAPLDATLDLHGGHLLTHPGRLRTGEGTPYKVYSPFARALRAAGVDRPAPAVTGAIAMSDLAPETPAAIPDLAPDMRRGRAVLDRFALPAGEPAALERLEDFLDRAGSYAAERDRPDRDSTSGLSEHLATGEISPRSVWAIAEVRMRTKEGSERGISKFLSEVIWREFAGHLLIAFPQMPTAAWRDEWNDFPWRGETEESIRWIRAETGVALVDAGLREMRVTGRMHNRVRMVVASWLTKHLLTDWRIGLRHFEDSLTDWDPASNAMNWQWVAGCGPDAAPYFRVFNPEKQAAEHDPKKLYRRRWLAGFDGAAGDEALAYLDSLPPDWNVARVWRDGATDATLAEGRQRALDAYEGFRAGTRGE